MAREREYEYVYVYEYVYEYVYGCLKRPLSPLSVLAA
jgi:hypothetical protein